MYCVALFTKKIGGHTFKEGQRYYVDYLKSTGNFDIKVSKYGWATVTQEEFFENFKIV